MFAAALTLLTGGCTNDWQPAFDETEPEGMFDNVTVADTGDALTFARIDREGERRLLAVTRYHGGIIEAVDLSAASGRPRSDAAELLAERGYDAVRDLVRGAPDSAMVAVPASQLVLPLDTHDHHIAAATNYPEHAGEAGVKKGPFLFAKLVAPTGPYAEVQPHGGLLDYEAEVAWVALEPIAAGVGTGLVGLVLANDFTDRETLMRHINAWDVESGDGFTTGKSAPGWLPLGNLLVVPRDHRRFVRDIELRLYVNGRLRQRSMASAMIWDFDEVVARTFAWRDKRWEHRGEQVSLLGSSAVIPARTLLLSGTPHGTVFAGLRARHFVGAIGSWLTGGWRRPAIDSVADAYAADARAAGAYLQRGDRVEIHVERLGMLRNTVVD